MARTLNLDETKQLDAMIERTSIAAVVSSIATYASIKMAAAKNAPRLYRYWQTVARHLNGTADRLPHAE